MGSGFWYSGLCALFRCAVLQQCVWHPVVSHLGIRDLRFLGMFHIFQYGSRVIANFHRHQHSGCLRLPLPLVIPKLKTEVSTVSTPGQISRNQLTSTVGIWMALNKLGSIIGNSIQLALNIHDSEKGSVSPNTYLALVGLSCAGLPLAMTIASPNKLIRKDGTKPTYSSEERISVKDGLKGLWRASKTKHMMLLLPIFITVRWSTTYQGNFLTEYFSVRGRTLAGFVATIVGTIATVLWGWLLDSQKIFRTRKGLAVAGWMLMLAFYIPQWVLNFVMQDKLQNTHPTPSLDIHDPGFGKAIAAYILFNVGSNASNVWTYWILGTYDVHVDVLAYTTGILRSAESLGFAVAYGIGASSNVSLMANLIVSFVVFWVSVPFTTYASFMVQERPEGESSGVEDPEQSKQVDKGDIQTTAEEQGAERR
ncbi:hypothetical protein AWENTII_007074 [Aspergillus wentii]